MLQTVEDLTRHVVRHSLNVSPVAWGLFGLRLPPQSQWLAPAQTIREVFGEPQPGKQQQQQVVAELRLRFKVPFPAKLRDLDRQAFIYYFHQVRATKDVMLR